MNKLLDNEKMFADTNAKLTEAASALAPTNFPEDIPMQLYCECANKVCQERVSITYDEYKDTKDPLTFVAKPDHYLPEFERVVKKTPDYWVI
ncbi:MAG TPA: hypothetical protein VK963_02675, partial [Candidatus Saccharimonadales bacterium]|nr:hypothetical protein [Candidatus Saccharimonadales bacterium]